MQQVNADTRAGAPDTIVPPVNMSSAKAPDKAKDTSVKSVYTRKLNRYNKNNRSQAAAGQKNAGEKTGRTRKAHKAATKKALTEEQRRVILSVRVQPSTMRYIKSMNYKSAGRALDVLVKAVQHGGIVRMLEARSKFSIVNLAG